MKSTSAFTPKDTDLEQLQADLFHQLTAAQAKLSAREKSRDNYHKLYMEEWAVCDRLKRVVRELEEQVQRETVEL